MIESRRETARLLGWISVIPFATLVAVAGWDAPGWLVRLLLVWGSLSLAFMVGGVWAVVLARVEERPLGLLAGFLIVLGAWPSVLLPLKWGCFWLALLFGLHLLSEWRWAIRELPAWYRRLRVGLSLAIITLLVLAGFVALGRG